MVHPFLFKTLKNTFWGAVPSSWYERQKVYSIDVKIIQKARKSIKIMIIIKWKFDFIIVVQSVLRQKKKIFMLPSPDQNLKIGSVSLDFFFFFFLRTVRELSFPIFFLKFLNGENSGGMQSKRIYKSCKCFFKPLNTNFSNFFAQIWHKKKKKNDPVFSHFTVGRERTT